MSDVRVYGDKAAVAGAAAARLVDLLRERTADGGHAHVVLTGGSMGSALVEALGRADTTGVAWDGVDLWWGDERFLPAGDPDRNDTQAYDAGLAGLGVPPRAVHAVPGPDSPGGEGLVAAASRYAAELRAAADGASALPAFDVVMLGVGPDGHVASLFPGHPAQDEQDAVTVAVEGSPKPPPRRVSMTFPALNSARQVWLLVAGEDKADAVARALTVTDPHDVPACGVRGREATIWWVDEAAAARVPAARRTSDEGHS